MKTVIICITLVAIGTTGAIIQLAKRIKVLESQPVSARIEGCTFNGSSAEAFTEPLIRLMSNPSAQVMMMNNVVHSQPETETLKAAKDELKKNNEVFGRVLQFMENEFSTNEVAFSHLHLKVLEITNTGGHKVITFGIAGPTFEDLGTVITVTK